jgi:hypothetical protein
MSGFPTPDRPASRRRQPYFPESRLLVYLTLGALLLNHWLSPDGLGLPFPGR